MMTTLLIHRQNLASNPHAYTTDIPRCYETVVKHLKDSGYKKLTFNRAPELIKEYVELIFSSQNRKPFFHIESDSGLPFCWNAAAKGGWDFDYIKYEWGHIYSRNQNADTAYSITNLCLQSARCNQHIQSSMNIDELKAYGGKLEEVIVKNMNNRDQLFNSITWKKLLIEFEHWR